MPVIERRVMVDQIDIFREGVVGVRMKKLAIAEDGSARWGFHRTSISPLDDAEGMLATVTGHFGRIGAGSFDDDEWERVLRTTTRVHDKATADAFAEREAKGRAGEDPDAGLDGAIVFSRTSFFRKTPGCDADKIDALILATPVQILAGFDPQPVGAGSTALFRLLPGVDIAAERLRFETMLGQSPPEPQWNEIGRTTEAEHTPDVVQRFQAEIPALIERGVLAIGEDRGRQHRDVREG